MPLHLLALTLVLQTPDFSGTIITPKMSARAGPLPLLTVLWDPGRPDHIAPSREQIESLIFGREKSVAGWWRENSKGKCTLQNAAVLGWYKADFPAAHYWRSEAEDKGRTGFLGGHVEKWTEALRKAEKDFDFAKYDRNRNGVLEPAELGILIVVPQNGPFGTMRTPAGREVPAWEPLVLDGVKIPAITEAYIGNPPNLGLVAHELSHLLLGAPDMYLDAPHRAGAYSLMDVSYRSVHLDPFLKLKLGWLKPRIVTRSSTFEIRTGEAALLYEADRGPQEYFLLEYRRRQGYDAEVPAEGVTVWHILEDPKDFGDGKTASDWGRWGVRLVRSIGRAPADDREAPFGVGASIELHWSNGDKGPTVRVERLEGGARLRANWKATSR